MDFYKGVAILVGTIIGVGIFGLPNAFLKSGIIPGALYLFLVLIILLLNHLFFGEIILRTNGEHRFIGYLRKYLGKYYAMIELGSLIFSTLGSMFVYILIGGQFLNNIFSGLNFSAIGWSIIFWLVFTFFVIRGTKLVADGELVLNAVLVITLLVISFIGISHIKIENLSANLLTNHIRDVLFPYGVLLFALSGGAAIPELAKAIGGEKKKLKKIIILGTVIPAILYLIFAVSVIGITGKNVSDDVFSSLRFYLGNSIVLVGSFFGFLAVATTFMVLGLYFKHTLIYDYEININLVNLIFAFVPISLFLLIPLSFTATIGFIGAVFGGIDGILMTLLYKKVKTAGERNPEYSLNISNFTLTLLIVLFLFGIIYQIAYII